ncbi:Hypothetical predicted protein [Octopus vulgaris]|uniref:Transmembrane protein n=1 Tax=Octopus vulgaris TaxID=6645 RepID=A0AA36BHU9_OCTVU|nr:Hypothetical predicted protein [Octopus vulgaris]
MDLISRTIFEPMIIVTYIYMNVNVCAFVLLVIFVNVVAIDIVAVFRVAVGFVAVVVVVVASAEFVVAVAVDGSDVNGSDWCFGTAVKKAYDCQLN